MNMNLITDFSRRRSIYEVVTASIRHMTFDRYYSTSKKNGHRFVDVIPIQTKKIPGKVI